MKKLVLAALAAAMISSGLYGQEPDKGLRFGAGVDLVSGYLWRGLREAGISLQPSLSMSAAGFSITAWGSSDFSGQSYKELDLTVAYDFGAVRLSVNDIYAVSPANGPTHYFEYGRGGQHRVEAGIVWRIAERVPLTVAWYTTLTGGSDYDENGKRVYASYAELSYPLAVEGIDLRGGIGIVPWKAVGVYGIDRDFYVQDIFLKADRNWALKSTAGLSLGLTAKVSWNPAKGDANVMCGVSLNM